MFGESESESPRVGSPWDSLLTSGASTPSSLSGRSDPDIPRIYKLSLPKLVPEVEEGNVEYKLQLIEPSPERFLRLVTQLKWRLLEGGGQAYYELGVADSGQLVGLTRQNLDRSLETLEAMAGEIGASVVVVKEIEVPPSMFEPANSNIMLPKSKGTGNGCGFGKTKGADRPGKGFRSRPSDWGAVEIVRGTNAAALISNGDTKTDGDLQARDEVCLTVRVSPHPVISELFPSDEGTPSPISSASDDGMFQFDPIAELQLLSTAVSITDQPDGNSPVPTAQCSTAALQRNLSKVPNHEIEKPLTPSLSISAFADEEPVDPNSNSEQIKKDLGTLHAPLARSTNGDGNGTKLVSTAQPTTPGIPLPKKKKDTKKTVNQMATTEYTEPIVEPRLIVEALVVRKLSADEAFLDFGGFALTD